MRIPPDAIIADEKLYRYLLIPRQHNDKSKFLRQVGFSVENISILEQAIRNLIAENDAVSDRQDEYGTFYQVTGDLVGLTGVRPVVTVWIYEAGSRHYRFVTLKPGRKR